MEFIKEETEDVKIEEAFRLKQEDTEEQTDLMPLKEESQELNEKKEENLYENLDFTTGEKTFGCSLTEKTSTQNRSLSCIQCGKFFSSHAYLEVHMRIHKGEKPFTCKQCGRSFTAKGSLTRHMRIHTGEKPFTCQQCGKSFSNRGHLRDHMNVHNAERPFTCSQCGKGFNQKNLLKKHMTYHCGEKPYICSQCGKSFRHKATLNAHLINHTVENPFVCGQCGKSFRYKATLNTHLRDHTRENPFVCGQCGKSFRCKNSLIVNGVEVPVHLIGDAAYPLKNWLMKGFTNHHALTPQQRLYNYRLSSARMVIENAFGRLKGRWRCLLKRNDVNTALMSDVVAACCVLHNICEMHEEMFLPDWNITDVLQEQVEDVFQGVGGRNAQAIREAMMTLF
uniref:C2H2-type domain-containing protein n=1 Tax=Cyprinus carpio carpio TaxID=630221 RepID=A0A9J8B1E5_CYPCA